MSDWMEYLYMQKECPTDVMGVQVKLTAVDPNGNFQDIGTATTDSAGKFGRSWTPPVQGDYQVTATFEGTESYGSSLDTTYFTVGPAPSPETPIEPEEPTEPEEPVAPLISTEVALIAAVAVVALIGVVAYWILRRRE
jgi:hypothetical protein